MYVNIIYRRSGYHQLDSGASSMAAYIRPSQALQEPFGPCECGWGCWILGCCNTPRRPTLVAFCGLEVVAEQLPHTISLKSVPPLNSPQRHKSGRAQVNGPYTHPQEMMAEHCSQQKGTEEQAPTMCCTEMPCLQ